MKTILLLPFAFFLLLFATACKKTSTEMLDERLDTTAVVKLQGSFIGLGSERVTGQAKIYLQNEKYYLALETFTTTNGPDLKVYLNQGEEPTTFIKLGDLKSTNGHQLYDIPGKPDFSKFKYVLIHCEQFNHLYGRAELR